MYCTNTLVNERSCTRIPINLRESLISYIIRSIFTRFLCRTSSRVCRWLICKFKFNYTFLIYDVNYLSFINLYIAHYVYHILFPKNYSNRFTAWWESHFWLIAFHFIFFHWTLCLIYLIHYKITPWLNYFHLLLRVYFWI